MKKSSRQDAWNVYLHGKLIDTVFYTAGSYTTAEVKQSLINHDHYNPGISVRKQTN